jgi:hypothetical protein
MTMPAARADRSTKRNRFPVRLAILYALLLVVGAMLISGVIAVRRQIQAARTHGETLMIHTAVRAYRQEFGALPSESPAELMKSFRGANPKKIVFMGFEPERLSSSGEFLDCWGEPFRIDVSDPTRPRVHSSGPNRKDEQGKEGSDDIVNWR